MSDRISLPVSRVTEIADKIRTISGTSTTMKPSEMASHLTTANSNVTTEAELIAQIISALEGKASGAIDLPKNARVYYIGNAVTATQNAMFETSAVGTLTE